VSRRAERSTGWMENGGVQISFLLKGELIFFSRDALFRVHPSNYEPCSPRFSGLGPIESGWVQNTLLGGRGKRNEILIKESFSNGKVPLFKVLFPS